MAGAPVPPIQEKDGSAASIIHRQQFSLPQLPTTSVTIYPARATVVRNIKGIALKPGRNEIILHQLTPKADENSIKVSGRLSNGKILLIADMTVDLVKPPAAHKTEEQTVAVKATSWEPDSDDDTVDLNSPVVSDNDTPTLKELSNKIKEVDSKVKKLREQIHSGDKQLGYLDRWGTTLTDKDLSKGSLEVRSTTAVTDFLNAYSEKRAEIMTQRAACSEELAQLEQDLAKLKKEKENLSARVLKKKRKVRDEKIREKEEEKERRREEGKEDKDTKAPEKWYRVRVWIDQEQVDEYEDTRKALDDVEGELELKYTVSDAGWASRYDIVISSIGDANSATNTLGKVTAHLTYNAHFQNRTYEIWKDAWITLSTSQTVFTGLADGAPILEPWRVRFIPAGAVHYNGRYGDGGESAVAVMLKSRAHAGLYSSQEKAGIDKEKKEEKKIIQPMEVHHYRKATKSKSKVALRRSTLAKAGSSAPSASAAIFSKSSPIAQSIETFDDGEESGSGSSESEDDSASISETLTRTLTLSSLNKPSPTPKPEPNFVQQGLTSSYSIPNRMTIPSTHGSSGDLESSTSAVRRHTILTMPLNQIQLSYACTPKLRAAAYLKARILNDSSTTLRKGLVGVTLDGTFIGSTPLPRTVYPGGIFNLPLGIDESVTVTYAKPSVKRNAQKGGVGGGIFSNSIMSWGKGQQEMLATYGRSTVIRNNRLDRGAIELVVCDQVPISEDARWVVTVIYPRGLKPPPPLQVPGGKNSRAAVPEEPEFGEGDEAEEEGSSMRMGQPVKTGTGVYIEGFSVIPAQEDTSMATPGLAMAQSAEVSSSAKLNVPPVSTSAGSDDDSASYKDTEKSKRKSLFSIKKSVSTKSSGGNNSQQQQQPPTIQPPQTHSRNLHAPESSMWNLGSNGKEEKWGSAVAAMRRNGEVVWKVKLNPGMGVRLGLEYSAKVPAGERIAGL